MPVPLWNSSKRRRPIKASRKISIVQRSPTTDNARATEQFMSLTERRIASKQPLPHAARPGDKDYSCKLKLRLLGCRLQIETSSEARSIAKPLKIFFDYVSPFSYLADTQCCGAAGTNRREHHLQTDPAGRHLQSLQQHAAADHSREVQINAVERDPMVEALGV